VAAGEIQKKTPLKQAHLNAMQQQGRAKQTLPCTPGPLFPTSLHTYFGAPLWRKT